MLFDFGEGIWVADGPQVTAALGFHYPTRMAVIRLADGGLMVWSPVALTPALRRGIDALGPVRHLVAPNNLHHVFLPDWASAWPDARICAAPGVARKQPGLALAATLGDSADPAWADEVDQVLLRTRIVTEVVFYHKPSRTVLIADLIQQLPPDWYDGWRARIARMDRMTEPEPCVPRKFRVALPDRTAARAAVARLTGWPADQVVLAHGPLVYADGQAMLTRAFDWLSPG